ncbi:uncharacterized protein LOC107489113 [Arachis duranensis]|uniref:ATP-dependent DNA helicase n=1 Tax=Arachis duranensis TaxID=130453 RepID=A0A6P4DB52_ARADU|nr:uncharacterized protein LOC107489113 [Arachis duranensis]
MVESERLKFFRCKQPQLRVDKYKYLHESLINKDVDAARLGKRIIFPSTFTGGPRYAGYPSYFITLTYVCTVEFQKRGLLHAHILLFMSNEFKQQTSYDIDKHITAEIPDENERLNLHGAIQNFMGNDRITATLYNAGDPPEATQVVDEIRNCYYCRYISACEVVWRLFGYEIQEKEPFVIRLPFHLEDEQPVVYGETSNVNDIVKRAISHKFIFLGWMTANISYPYARNLTYAEFPTKFVWKDDSLKWFPRKKGFAIGRLTHVPTANTEEYYQRLLLNTQKGCMSLRDIRTVGGIIYATYRDACFALGLLQDDKEFIDTIKEASSWASGSYVRRLFVILLTSKNISRPEHVWDRCWHQLSDDILYRQRAVMNIRELTMLDDEIKQLCLMDIDKILHFYGKIFKDYPHMPLTTEVDSSLLTERVIKEELNFNRDDLKKNVSDMLAIATSEQRYTFDKIVTAVYCDEGGGDIVLNIASSGIASLLFPNGRTAHSKFKTLPNITEDSVCNIKPDSPQAILLLKAKLIFWDEAPMVSRYCYEALDKCLGDIMRCSPIYSKDLPFGGKVVVLGEDFRQIFSIILRGSRQDIVHSTVNSSYLWKFY